MPPVVKLPLGEKAKKLPANCPDFSCFDCAACKEKDSDNVNPTPAGFIRAVDELNGFVAEKAGEPPAVAECDTAGEESKSASGIKPTTLKPRKRRRKVVKVNKWEEKAESLSSILYNYSSICHISYLLHQYLNRIKPERW